MEQIAPLAKCSRQYQVDNRRVSLFRAQKQARLETYYSSVAHPSQSLMISKFWRNRANTRKTLQNHMASTLICWTHSNMIEEHSEPLPRSPKHRLVSSRRSVSLPFHYCLEMLTVWASQGFWWGLRNTRTYPWLKFLRCLAKRKRALKITLIENSSC